MSRKCCVGGREEYVGEEEEDRRKGEKREGKNMLM
jgi:hypothetical protein